jgi:hypothetical protein
MVAQLPGIGLGATLGGDIGGGIAQARAASYQAQVARNNALVESRNAAHAAQVTAVQTEDEGLKARSQGAQVRAGLAAQGVNVNSGSAADVQAGQRLIGALDQSTVANRGAEAVYGYQTEATGYQAQAKLDQAEVGSDVVGGILKGAGAAAGESPNIPGGIASTISGSPSVPSAYQWMSQPPPQGVNDPYGENDWDH